MKLKYGVRAFSLAPAGCLLVLHPKLLKMGPCSTEGEGSGEPVVMVRLAESCWGQL